MIGNTYNGTLEIYPREIVFSISNNQSKLIFNDITEVYFWDMDEDFKYVGIEIEAMESGKGAALFFNRETKGSEKILYNKLIELHEERKIRFQVNH